MKSFIALFVLAAVLATGEAIKCYNCTSVLDKKCGEVFDSSAKLNVTEDSCIVCTKSVVATKNKTIVERGCGIKNNINSLAASQPDFGDVVNAALYLCKSDKCNGTNSITAGLSALIALSIASILMSRI